MQVYQICLEAITASQLRPATRTCRHCSWKGFFSRTAIEPCALQIDDQMVSSLPEHVQIWLEIRLQTDWHLRLDFNLITSMVSRSSPRPPPGSSPGLTCQRCWELEWARPICSSGLRAGLLKRCLPICLSCFSAVALKATKVQKKDEIQTNSFIQWLLVSGQMSPRGARRANAFH